MEVVDTLPVIACIPRLFIATLSCSCNDFNLVFGNNKQTKQNLPYFELII